MTRGYFASQGINASVRTVRLRRKDGEVPNRTATLDVASLMSKYRGGSARQVADVIITNVRFLQKFFPRVLMSPDGPIKPGKEDRSTSPPTKQQHLDGRFDLADQRYTSTQLAMRELVQTRSILKRADGLPDIEVVASGGEGEDGAWFAYEGLARESYKVASKSKVSSGCRPRPLPQRQADSRWSEWWQARTTKAHRRSTPSLPSLKSTFAATRRR